MKRKIEFRGKRIDNGEWVYGYYLSWKHFDGKKFVLIHAITNDSITYQVHPETVGQFTGLLDKNGMKIFEGDILKHVDKYGKLIILCKYEFNQFAFYCKSLERNIYPSFINDCEIIGNIHDNEELLK